MQNSQVLVPACVVDYPKLSFWAGVPKEQRLQLVNSSELPLEETLKALGIQASSLRHGFGICDPSEIRSRQSVMRWLVNDQLARQWLLANSSIGGTLPANAYDFILAYAGPEDKSYMYWKKLREFSTWCEKIENPPHRLQVMLTTLKQSWGLEKDERRMADAILERMKEAVYIEGTVPVHVEISRDGYVTAKIERDENKRSSFFGRRLYSYEIVNLMEKTIPEWMDVWVLRDLWHWQYQQAMRKAAQPLIMHHAPEGLWYAIECGVNTILGENKLKDIFHQAFDLHVKFVCRTNSLEIRFCGLSVPGEHAYISRDSFDRFPGYSGSDRAKIDIAMDEVNTQISLLCKNLYAGRFAAKIIEQSPEFFERLHNLPCARVTEQVGVEVPTVLYRTAEFSNIVLELQKHREFFGQLFAELRGMAQLAENVLRVAQDLKSPICFPQFIDGHVVSFSKLMPVHLQGQNISGIRPIGNMPDLNGQMIGITGKHGGGKTVTCISIPMAIYMAQSGLPVLAEAFSLNVKRVMGAVFIDRAKGSTAEALVQKLTEVVRTSLSYPGREVVLVLDELGSATQEVAGFELGRDILARLKKAGVSVLFSTQIVSLAQYAEQHFDALCYQIDNDHNILPGIGDGGMNELRQRSGLDDLLQV